MFRQIKVKGGCDNTHTNMILIEGSNPPNRTESAFREEGEKIAEMLRETLPCATLDIILIRLLEQAVIEGNAHTSRDIVLDSIRKFYKALFKK